MYVHVVSFKVKPGEEITFVELQKFEEKMDAKPAGLDHFHIFKDLNEKNRFFLIEYWQTKEDKEKLEASSDYKHFQDLRKLAIEKKFEIHECDLVV
jgi:quinol monooxygenase YgiN